MIADGVPTHLTRSPGIDQNASLGARGIGPVPGDGVVADYEYGAEQGWVKGRIVGFSVIPNQADRDQVVGERASEDLNVHGVGAEVSRVDGPQAIGIFRTKGIPPESRDATVFDAPARSDIVNASENGRLAVGQVVSLKREVGHDYLGSEDAEEGHPDKTQGRVRLAHSRSGPKYRARRTR